MFSSRGQRMVNMINTNIEVTSTRIPLKEVNAHQDDGKFNKPVIIKEDAYLKDCADLKPPTFLLPNETSTTLDAAVSYSISLADVLLPFQKHQKRDNIVASSNASRNDNLNGNVPTFPDEILGIEKENNTPPSRSNLLMETELQEFLDFPRLRKCPLECHMPGTSNNSSSTKSRIENKLRISKTLVEDLISSSESDPFGGDDEDADPDYDVALTPSRDLRETLTDSSASSIEPERKRKTRKRLRNAENWQRNKIKTQRNSGEAYTDWKGKKRPEKKIKATCQNCRIKCAEKINQQQRNTIFRSFWDLKDVNRQRDYISKYVECNRKARTRKRKSGRDNEQQNEYDDNSKKTFTFTYFLQNATSRCQVCKVFFLNTLSISAQTVRTVFNKINSAGYVTEDRRGKACKNSILDESVKKSVRDHINMFETVDSHYCRQKTERKYLPPTLNISKMFMMYEEYCIENNIARKATESMYRHIFTTEFNISFFLPKKDLCDMCHSYENSLPEKRFEMEEEYKKHIENKNVARNLKNTDKEKAKEQATFCAAVFDLQQVLPVPKTEVGVAYYKLKLSTFNFTVFNLASKEAFCYMWHECMGKRGSSEVGSCLLNFIEQHIKKGIEEFSFFSDNCPGQNRNKFLFSLYNYLTQKYSIKIQHTFLERGHTQSEGDSVHSVIEKAARHIPVYTPDQWYTLVRSCKKKNPYVVVEMAQENIFDLKLLQQTSMNWEKNEANDKVVWGQLKIVKTDPRQPNIIFYKSSYKYEDDFRKLNLITKGRKTMQLNIKEIHLQQLYKNLIPLTKKKYEHLEFLCNRNAILPAYHTFFQHLPFGEHVREQNASDGEDS